MVMLKVPRMESEYFSSSHDPDRTSLFGSPSDSKVKKDNPSPSFDPIGNAPFGSLLAFGGESIRPGPYPIQSASLALQ